MKGAWTALITPFTETGIDFESLEKLIERQIEGGVTGILVIGTTGESPTLSEKECEELIKNAKRIINGRCKLMAGCGTNCTEKSIDKARKASECKPDCLMAVNPYYNKPTQEGLYRHFKAICENTDLPVVLYNIKGRTGVNVETDTLLRIIEDCPNLVGVKEASGDLDQIKEVCEKTPEDFTVLAGDDGVTYTIMNRFGAHGAVSVASNIVPARVVKLINEISKNENEALAELFKTMFIETNPIPVKYAASLLGLCKPIYRLPMCEPSEESKRKIKEVLKNYELHPNN